MLRTLPVCLLGLSFLANNADAADDGAFRQQEAHEHGHATLNIVIEGNAVIAEMEIPALSLLGFEHVPTTPDEIAAVAELRQQLSGYRAILDITGLDCTQQDTADVFRMAGEEAHEEEQTGLTDAGEAHAHADVLLRYGITCNAAPKEAALTVFAMFPGVEEVLVQWISDLGQGGVELTPGNSRIMFGQP